MPDSLSLDELTEERLRAVGIHDAEKGLRFARELAGQGVTDDDVSAILPRLLDALRACPDADRALSSFSRWFAVVGGRTSHLQLLLRHSIALDIFCQVTGSSQYFADLLVRQPEYFEILANPGVRGGAKSASALYREVSSLVNACRRPELKRDALRRWKAREMLRIGVRDLVGLADMPSTAREFSNLADACVQMAYDVALATYPVQSDQPADAGGLLGTAREATQLPFAVIAMGKLGGQELNYSSDIDLMFVQGDSLPPTVVLEGGRTQETPAYLTRIAETIVKVLNEDTANGHVFRVDMRLRPEGRFGALVRSLSSYRAYYESWAENWERQALLKARFIAGDRALGEEFQRLIQPFVYRRRVSMGFIEEIRHNKRRIEQKCDLEGQTETNIKTGYGGIRDIEFAVQLMQLEFGGMRPRLRTTNTLSGIQRLYDEDLLLAVEADEMSEDYQFLRNLEHRLQLLHGFQTQTLPSPKDAAERRRVAWRMGYPDLESFELDLAARRARCRDKLDRMFYAHAQPQALAGKTPSSAWSDVPELLENLDSPAVQSRLQELLSKAGIHDVPKAMNALQLPMRGNEFGGMPPDTPVEFKAVVVRLMELVARSADPDAALAGIETMALAVPNRAQLYASFRNSPQVMERMVTLGAVSPPLLRRLAQHLEWMDAVFAEEDDESATALTADVRRAVLQEELSDRMQGAPAFESKLDILARFYQRETLRIGANNLWRQADVLQTMSELTALADVMLQTLMDICAESIAAEHSAPEFARSALRRAAVIGLGKLGGAELAYSSDWDVVFVYSEPPRYAGDSERSEVFPLVNTLVERVLAAGNSLAPRGASVEIDLRLRPWGKKGALIHSLRGFIAYYRESGETWERQAALKARYSAGNATVGARFVRILHAVSFGRGITPEEDGAIQAMKRRIETERLKSAEQDTDLKLGHGGLTDVEWLAQRLQLRHGRTRPSLRRSGTLEAITALASSRLLGNAEADVLTAAYVLQTQARNALWLQTGSGRDILPGEERKRRALAKILGWRDSAAGTAEARFEEELHEYRREVRRIFEQRFFTTAHET